MGEPLYFKYAWKSIESEVPKELVTLRITYEKMLMEVRENSTIHMWRDL